MITKKQSVLLDDDEGIEVEYFCEGVDEPPV